jgi:leader peptidase (prepilin peptidase)/N-methyltransferase
MIYIILFIFGSVIGSFLNVLIYRMPREEKIGLSRSRCPHCKKTIVWYDNIPFFSYIFLKGKCRNCKGPISLRYFIVEFITAFMLCVVWWKYGNPVFSAVYFVFAAMLIVDSFIDLEFFIIPDATNFIGLLFGLLVSAIFPQLLGEQIWWHGLLRSLLGAFVGGVSLFLIAVVAEFMLKKEAMGMGDVKLLAMMGSFIGWKMVLFTIFASSLLGTIGGILLIIFGKTTMKGRIPFGPYLAMGAVVSLFWGEKIIQWYAKLLW